MRLTRPRTHALALAASMLALSACNAERPERARATTQALDAQCTQLAAGLIDHACFHAMFGPFVPVTASAVVDYATATPNINTVHTHYTITLPAGSSGAHSGTIKYRPARSGDWSILANPETSMDVLDPSGAVLPLLLQHTVSSCSELPLARVYELTANVTYRLRFNASPTPSVGVVLEKLSDFETAYYADSDADGFGDANSSYLTSCTAPAGHVADDTDCDDAAPTVFPGASELCDGVDNDCDANIDEEAGTTFYGDVDGDGHGSASNTAFACTAPSGFVANSDDCDDASGAVHPGASEVCNSADEDCDGSSDEAVTNACGSCGAVPSETCDGADNDCDGSTDEGVTNACGSCGGVGSESCDEVDNDCDGAIDEGVTNACGGCGAAPTEVCDGADNDCDGSIDEEVTDACGGCGVAGSEVCDSVDNDCDGSTDEGVTNACGGCGALPAETCDGTDEDCDGTIDEDAALITYYADADGDGFGDASVSQQSCVEPAGYITDNTDCNDDSAEVYPGAQEVCNSEDDNCNGEIDDIEDPLEHVAEHACGHAQLGPFSSVAAAAIGAPGPDVSTPHRAYTIELPGAGSGAYAGEVSLSVLNEGELAVLLSTETALQVVDAGGAVVEAERDEASETCPELGHVRVYDLEAGDYRLLLGPGSENVTLMVIERSHHEDDEEHDAGQHFFLDADADGFGDPARDVFACTAPAGYVVDDTDCNDGAADVNPGAEEICDEVDNDCDGTIDTIDGMSVCACQTVVVEASKSYDPPCWTDGEVLLDQTATFVIPSEIPVTAGNAGNHYAYLYFADLAAVTPRRPVPPVVKCTYRGDASRGGESWIWRSCTRQYRSGDEIAADYVRLNINGSKRHGTTRARLELYDLSCN